ncbi:MAG TPA: hypothetical protein VMV29_20170 [Ktedonobacterales bacterium]|nr:hypothetical protein [Ktedonobacterales bacterium]
MGDEYASTSLTAMAAPHAGRIALTLGARDRWRAVSDYLFAPLDLPGGPTPAQEPAALGVARLARQWLGCDAALVPSQRLYGPSAAHAIDRLSPTADDDPLPLLRLTRLLPRETTTGDVIGATPTLTVQVYLARLVGEPQPTALTAGLLWLTLPALLLALRGQPLAETLAHPDTIWAPAPSPHAPTPDELASLFVYTPGDYGERHLLRIAAKYGANALFQGAG